ncbi:MAG: Gfo/Idh/MocA family oxidoreductase [Chitinophagaceae bacterium]|nr:MAG: Gfo/Idh/MocA family oxidoreductase [Chitinophagaceae bacterium]
MKYLFNTAAIVLLAMVASILPIESRGQSARAHGPVRIAVAGTSHAHVSWILGRQNQQDAVIVGIYEPDQNLIKRQVARYKLDSGLVYNDLGAMLDKVKPEAVVAFGSIYDHMKVVEAAAPRGIHVMVEKPLATNVKHVLRMEQLAKKHNIHVLTNYETSWYPTTEKIYQLVHDSVYLGGIRKVVIHDGHEGPKEIGVNKEFLDWLTDPVQNGGGALIDFGCYGANLMTYLMKGEMPVSVTAVSATYKPAIYPRVDDETTIIVSYPKAQCIIQASWNWPFSRKDMEVYGETGYLIAADHTVMRKRNRASKGEQTVKIDTSHVEVYTDPFSYLADVVRGKITVTPHSLYSLENNILVVRILEAARESARTGKTVLMQK